MSEQDETIQMKESDMEYWLERCSTLTAENKRYKEALERVSENSEYPNGHKFYDEYGDYINPDTDSTNSGDVHNHGFEMGLHAQSLIARQALSSQTGGDDV